MNQKHIEVRMGSERNFGIVFAIVFLIIGTIPLIGDGGIRIWAICIAFVFLICAFFIPGLLSRPNKIWFKFGLLLGTFISPIVMAFVYFAAVVPTGLIVKLLGIDLLRQDIDKELESYWIERKQPVSSMKDQF